METVQNIRLTSAEMGTLWTTYVEDTMARCVLSYFLHKVEDPEIKPVVEFALSISEGHIKELGKFFESEHFPVPVGFTDIDVNLHAKRLFADTFFLYYIKNMSKVGLVMYSIAYSMASRSDIRTFFRESLMMVEKLDQRVTEVLQMKGLYIRPPYIPTPEHVDFIKDKSFLSGGFFGFAEKRPLIAIEISHLFMNVQTNGLGRALLLGFSQVVQSQELRKYLVRGVEISNKHITIFSDRLQSEHLPVPMTWDSDVINSSEAPFSDKLILFHVSVLVAAGTSNYTVAAVASPRRDIASDYARLSLEIGNYAADGDKMMIEHGWLEEPPQAPDRKELRKM
jgi:hypothetical protein